MKKKKQILILEDDLSILMGLSDNLTAEGYEVMTASNGLDGLKIASEQPIDLLLLDIMLPGINGFEICKKIKTEKPLLPVLMLTARSSEMDKIAGLDYGADDYITKPFSISELLARVRAILRRVYPENKTFDTYAFGKVRIDFKKMETFVDGKPIHFTKKEFLIMDYFIQHAGEVVHRHDLLNEVWGYSKVPTTRTVDNFILDIRKKIEDQPSNPKHIVSVSGIGYKFNPKY
ncbi:response regulator transcription factor [Flavobacteriaceae bacterium S0862]|nr:response regulator transcription factor [Flavobacteriaceae bacterium S0862]